MSRPAPVDARLYAAVKREANAKFLAPTSAYRSAWIVRTYKKRGGAYSGGRPSSSSPLKRWFMEKWVDVSTRKACGRRSSAAKGPYPLCRPSVRVTGNTPKTLHELDDGTLRLAHARKQTMRHRGKVRF